MQRGQISSTVYAPTSFGSTGAYESQLFIEPQRTLGQTRTFNDFADRHLPFFSHTSSVYPHVT